MEFKIFFKIKGEENKKIKNKKFEINNFFIKLSITYDIKNKKIKYIQEMRKPQKSKYFNLTRSPYHIIEEEIFNPKLSNTKLNVKNIKIEEKTI